MRGLRGWLRRSREEGGFTLAEVLIAGLVMVVAMVPIIGMFDGALGAVRNVSNIHASVACAQTAVEQIRAMPFYRVYNGTNQDIDDFYWGNRSPINTNPEAADGNPDWVNIPEVAMYNYGAMPDYEAYRVGVKLAYLDDSTGVCPMASAWGPKIPANDRPKDADGREIHLLAYQVTVHWMVGGSETGVYSETSTVTNTQSIYNLGISGITVTAPAALIGTTPSAGVHWPSQSLSVTITGWGFDPSTITASLVRDRNNDVPISLATKSDTQLTGTVNISTSGTSGTGHYWYPKDDIGYWSVKVRQGDFFTVYLYNGFVVEYPKPIITNFYNKADSTKSASDIKGPFTIHADGGRFIYIAENPTVRLVQVVDTGDPAVITGTVTSVTGANYGYSDSGCAIEASFDPTGQPQGEYKLEIVDTRPGQVGHVSSGFTADNFTLLGATPAPTDVATNTGSLHYAFDNSGNPWRLKFTGSNFNMSGTPAVSVTLCSALTADGQPSGNQVSGTVVSVSGYNTIVADFNLTTLPAGFYYGWVKNDNNNLTGATATAVFEVRSFSASFTGFSANTGNSFFENYYNIPSTITGTGLQTINQVKITNGSTTYDITSDCTLGSDTTIPVSLNLISCDHNNAWKIQIYFLGGSYLERDFSIGLGPAKILPASNTKAAIRIHAIRLLAGDQWNSETLTAKAWAWQTTLLLVAGYGTFEVHGMGFPMTGSNTTLRVWKSTWSAQANCAAVMDRAGKDVKITGPQWQMPSSTGTANVSVQNNVGDTTIDSYTNRWQLNS